MEYDKEYTPDEIKHYKRIYGTHGCWTVFIVVIIFHLLVLGIVLLR